MKRMSQMSDGDAPAGVRRSPGPLRDALFLEKHLVLGPEEVLAVVIDGLELEIQAVRGLLKIRKDQSELEKKPGVRCADGAGALRRGADPGPVCGAPLGAGHRGGAVEAAPGFLCLGHMSGLIRRPPLSKHRNFTLEQTTRSFFYVSSNVSEDVLHTKRRSRDILQCKTVKSAGDGCLWPRHEAQ